MIDHNRWTLLAGTCLLALSSAASAQTNVTWQMWAGSEEEVAVFQHMAEMVTAKYPDITVTLQTAAWNDYWTKLPVQAASGQLADIVSMQSLRMPAFYTLLDPLDERIAADKFDIDAFTPSIISGMSAAGNIYGIPYDVGPWVMYYNQDAFAAAGVPNPTIGWTQSEFLEAAKKVTTGETYAYATYPGNFPVIATALGAKYLDDSGNIDLANDDVSKVADTLIGHTARDKIAPQIASGMDPFGFVDGRFITGNIAMILDGPWSLLNKKDTVKFKLGMTSFPRADDKDLTMPTAGSGFGVSTTSQNKDAAWKAIQVLTGPEALGYLAELGRALPARTAQQSKWYDTAAVGVDGAREAVEYSLTHSTGFPLSGNWATVENLLNQYLPPAFSQGSSGKETMEAIQALVQE